MTDNPDYQDLLDDNVSEAKKAIRELENPDYSELLEIEENNKDRKTIKEFLENKMENEEVEIEEEEEEVVEEIEEETSSGLLGSYSPESLLAGGLVFGLIIGLVVGFGGSEYAPSDTSVAENTVSDLLEASGFQGDVTFTESREESGLYYVSANLTSQGENGTQTGSRSFYVTKDGSLLFPEVDSPFITSPINVEEALQNLNNNQQPQSGNSTNTTNQ